MHKRKWSNTESPAPGKGTDSAGDRSDKVRAVAFKINDRIFEGNTGESHCALYLSLLRSKQVPSKMLDLWTHNETNHGFVTESGVFLNRPEVFRRFGTDRSESLLM